ncbi:MAG TPA: substrate-binding domain-containing protein [Prolixibacteraceae bacterium]|nr:substrate-binding domain-containing protein [Prolixibacteraceae bacterium]
MKKTSLNDIAIQLGVSKTLVSFVLNGKSKEFRISDDICKKVIDLAKELNYQPNRIAQGLRTGKTNTIGLIIADIANQFFGKLGREIEQEAARHGYRVIFCSSDENPEKSKQQIAMLQQSQVDGFIISPPMNSEEQIRSLSKSNIPYVLIDRYFPEIESNYIVIDNFDAAYRATSHLLKLGRKRIANITVNLDLVIMKERTEGYKQALRDAGVEVDENLVKVLPFTHNNKDIDRTIKELVGKRNNKMADAILFSTSKLGIMGIECISALGLKIPDDLAIVSFDDPDAYRICVSPVTVINQPLKEIGKIAVQVLLNKIKHPIAKNQKIILKTDFIIRKSCGS